MTTFQFSKQDFIVAFKMLDLNDWNERSAFWALWGAGRFSKRPRHEAPFLLGQLYRIKCLKEIFSRDAERCWNGQIKSNEWSGFGCRMFMRPMKKHQTNNG